MQAYQDRSFFSVVDGSRASAESTELPKRPTSNPHRTYSWVSPCWDDVTHGGPFAGCFVVDSAYPLSPAYRYIPDSSSYGFMPIFCLFGDGAMERRLSLLRWRFFCCWRPEAVRVLKCASWNGVKLSAVSDKL